MAETLDKATFDSDQQYIGTVYGKALLGAAEKAGKTEAVIEEFDSLVGDVLAELPKLEATLSSPRVPLETKTGILDKAFGGKMSVELLNFLKVVVAHGRFDCLRAINRAAKQLYNESRNRVEVVVRSAEPLDVTTVAAITKKLQEALGKEIDLKTEVDPDVIGGLVVRVGDTVFDASVANQLVRLRDETLARTAQAIRESLDRFTLAE